MNADREVRPALARYLHTAPDEPAVYTYSEQLQVSLWADGLPVAGTSSDEIGTFAERDTPEPSTSTRAESDPGDLVDASLWQRRNKLRLTATEAGRDPGEPTTVTKAARDPGDVVDETLSRRVADRKHHGAVGHAASHGVGTASPGRRLRLSIFTEAARDRDDDSDEPDGDATGDLVTGIVAF